jgi:GMP synthase-like glutamine amidotransferase
MRPVAIFRHSPTEGPGYLATFLDRHRVPWRLVAVDQGEPVPTELPEFSGLVFMGGPMSVNDALPWIPPELDLIRRAVAADVPVLGHCLGGQLMSKALGGAVDRNPVKEIGWGEVRVLDNATARDWVGPELNSFVSFHWHGESFTIPEGATRIMESAWCPNQAFVLGRHLAMQCHVEMTEELVRSWCRFGAREIAASRGPSVQSAQAMRRNMETRIAALHGMAERLYKRWIEGLKD